MLWAAFSVRALSGAPGWERPHLHGGCFVAPDSITLGDHPALLDSQNRPRGPELHVAGWAFSCRKPGLRPGAEQSPPSPILFLGGTWGQNVLQKPHSHCTGGQAGGGQTGVDASLIISCWVKFHHGPAVLISPVGTGCHRAVQGSGSWSGPLCL